MEVSSTIRRENQSDEFFFIFPLNLVNLIITHSTYVRTTYGYFQTRHVIILRRATGFTQTKFLWRSSLKLFSSSVVRPDGNYILQYLLQSRAALHHVVHGEFINLCSLLSSYPAELTTDVLEFSIHSKKIKINTFLIDWYIYVDNDDEITTCFISRGRPTLNLNLNLVIFYTYKIHIMF